jgi:predicted nucleotide-binding protein
VLDWNEDFAPAGSILAQIEEAAARCTAGIFLFTKDDKFDSDQEPAAPRDNVVFEAGFFAHAKGKERVLIVRETGSKMPADLGGDIYASLDDRSNIEPVKPVIGKFIDQRL